MNREQLTKSLLGRVNDSDYDRIAANFPTTDRCPTCDDETVYYLDGERHDCDCKLQRLLQRSYYVANIPREYHTVSLDDFFGQNRDIVVPIVNEYVNNFGNISHYGLGLTFCGSYGTGKTFGMATVLKELTKNNYNTFFITFDELVMVFGDQWKNGEAKDLYQRLKTAEVLGLDELKTDGRNENGFLADALQNIIRHRTSNLLPTLLTTNLTPDAQEAHFGKAFSLLSAKNELVILAGEDSRPEVKRRSIELASKNERRPIN